MILADLTLALEPAYPWSIPTIGPAAMLGVALALAALTVWTYLGVKQATWRRVLIVLLLRLGALAIAFSIVLRPSVAVTQLDGVEPTKLLVVLDASKSMDVADVDGKPTRWDQAMSVWKSPGVQRRLQQLKAEQKIEIVKYLGAEDLRPDEPSALPNGPRTDIGAWLHELWQKHGQDKHLRGILLFSDGADNGTRFPTQEKARRWRGIAPIQAFGVGDPNSTKFKKDLGLTKLDVEPEPIFVKTKMTLKAVAQAPGFDKTEFDGAVSIEKLGDKNPEKLPDKPIPKFKITQEKDFRIPKLEFDAPAEPGEYKVTVKITPHADETNKENNEISTYVQVIKESINVLWVDRPRVYEPKRIIDLALKPQADVKVHFVEVRPETKDERFTLYDLAKHYDVIVIGDISAQAFALDEPKVFDRIKELVEKHKTGLLMLGGSETFAQGGWQEHPSFMNLLPADFNLAGKDAAFVRDNVQVLPPAPAHVQSYKFLQIDPALWKDEIELDGLAPVGKIAAGSSVLLKGDNDKPVLIATGIKGSSNVALFTGDSTAERWFGSENAARAFTHFWRHLILWLAQRDDRNNPLVVKLDKRRLTTDASDLLGFTVSLRDKDGNDLTGATFTAKVERGKDEYPVRLIKVGKETRGTFQGAKEPGEYRLVIKGTAGNVADEKTVRFLVATDDIETLRPVADHETLIRIASSAEGRFHPATEEAFLDYLEELQNQVGRESRHKTTHWPDWNRLPTSEHPRDQLAALWHSCALLGMLLFVALLGSEWLLRRWWGLV